MRDFSELMVKTNEAVASAVGLPPWRPEPKPPTYEISVLGFSENLSRTGSKFKLKSNVAPIHHVRRDSPGGAKLILRNGLPGLGGTAQLLQFEKHRDGALKLSIEMHFIAG